MIVYFNKSVTLLLREKVFKAHKGTKILARIYVHTGCKHGDIQVLLPSVQKSENRCCLPVN